MVSTRSSLAPNESLEALDMSQRMRRSTRSPSPRKRKPEEETPEQSFVDARATPFTQRKRRNSSMSMDSPILRSLGSTNKTNKTIVDGDAAAAAAASKLDSEDSEDSESSDDEAPEAITNASTAKLAKELLNAQQEESKRRAEETREKRRKRDEVLRTQKQSSKAVTISEDSAQAVGASADEEEVNEDGREKPKRLVIPRMLPDEILNQPQLDTDGLSPAGSSLIAKPTHIKFEAKKEVMSLQKGPLMVQLLKKQRRDMAPKQSASIANTKKQWLYERGQHSENRRPVKKPLV